MAKYREHLPQLGAKFFLTDGGLETTLIFNEGIELPDFAAFPLLGDEVGTQALRRYFETYASIARRYNTGLILESPTWRASADWGDRLGFSADETRDLNRRAIVLLESVRSEYESETTPIVISGCLGPRGDGYVVSSAMTAEQAKAYHQAQMDSFASSNADMACVMTMNYTEEAIGVARAAESAGMPIAIAYTVETDGNLPTGQSLQAAIERVDEETGGYPVYYMINCAHPTHFAGVVSSGGAWGDRIQGVRANASRRSHAELNEAPDLDSGNPHELAREYADLRRHLTRLNVMGGCCGTDHRHIECIADANAMQ